MPGTARVVAAAWHDYGDPRGILDVTELSAMVSTNRVYRLTLEDATRVIAKSSNYGSFFLFAEDHDRLHRVNQLLRGAPFERFLAGAYTRDGEPYIWYDGEMWAIFYEEIEARDRLPSILTDRAGRAARRRARAVPQVVRRHRPADPAAVEDRQVRRRQPVRDDRCPQRRPRSSGSIRAASTSCGATRTGS